MTITEQLDAMQKQLDAMQQFLNTVPNAIGTLSKKIDALQSVPKDDPIIVNFAETAKEITTKLDQISAVLYPTNKE